MAGYRRSLLSTEAAESLGVSILIHDAVDGHECHDDQICKLRLLADREAAAGLLYRTFHYLNLQEQLSQALRPIESIHDAMPNNGLRS